MHTLTGGAERVHVQTDLVLGSVENDVPLGQQQDVIEDIVDLRRRLQERNQDGRLHRQKLRHTKSDLRSCRLMS